MKPEVIVGLELALWTVTPKALPVPPNSTQVEIHVTQEAESRTNPTYIAYVTRQYDFCRCHS